MINILIGASGSGKSTMARRQWLVDPHNTIVLSRDSLRKSLFGIDDLYLAEYYYNRHDLYKLEKLVTMNFHELLLANLSRGKKIIADNTHLKKEYIDEYQKYNVSVDLTIINPPLKKCLENNSNRAVPLAEGIIKKQHSQLKSLINVLTKEGSCRGDITRIINYKFTQESLKKAEYDPTKEDCVVVDIDGTIADHKGARSPYDWKAVGIDQPKEDVIKVIKKIASSGMKIILCTGRDAEGALATQDWLQRHDIPFHAILTRQKGDSRADYVIKTELWRQIETMYNITMMFDDRRQVIDHARSMGYTVADVANHTF